MTMSGRIESIKILIKFKLTNFKYRIGYRSGQLA